MENYVGRFAPSPTGPLHMGSLVAALASWLDARAHLGRWLVRIEDVDQTRCKAAHAQTILRQLAAHGLFSDAPIVWQTRRLAGYDQALQTLRDAGLVYPCTCSRTRLLQSQTAVPTRHSGLVYPGFCRQHPVAATPSAAWRFRVDQTPAGPPNHESRDPVIYWQDRLLGHQSQNVATQVGDFVVKRADGLFAYQLAVVVDDAAQGVTHVVRGQDLADNTPRQLLLQQALGYPGLVYLHTPLVRATNGEKLSKQNGAQPLNPDTASDNLTTAAGHLGLRGPGDHLPLSAVLADLVGQWKAKWAPR